MTRRVIHRVLVIALVIWICSQVAVTGGGSIAADIQPNGALLAPGYHGSGPGFATEAGAGQSINGGAGQPLASLGAATLVEWMNAVMISTGSGVEGAAWIVPPTILTAPGPPHNDTVPNFDNVYRETIYRDIAESPGRYIAAIASSTGIPESTVRYHVRVLEDDGLVESTLFRGKRCCYVQAMDEWVVTLEAALDDESIAPILEGIARLEPVTVTALSEDVDAAASTISYHLERLAAHDLVIRERAGQTVETRLDADVRAYLDETNGFDRDSDDTNPP